MNILSKIMLTTIGSFLTIGTVCAQPAPNQQAAGLIKRVSSSGKTFSVPLKSPLPPYLSILSTRQIITAGNLPIIGSSVRAITTDYHKDNTSINREIIKGVILKNQKEKEKQKRKRTMLVDSIALHQEALLRGYHLPENYLEGFFTKRIFPYKVSPHYTADKDSDHILYRGMLLTPEELIQIIQKGFSPTTSKWNAGTDGRPAISLSSSSVEASHYIFQSGSKKRGIGVVFEIRRRPSMQLGKDPIFNRTQTIYYSYQSIVPEDIVNIAVWGEYGLENLQNILKKAAEGNIHPHTRWTNQFGCIFF